ncbi:MAG: cell division FtsA domain-containing protein [Christensenellales bacterium]|jgi:cell division protein FtsA
MAKSGLISVLDVGSKKISVFIGAKGVNEIFIVKAKSEMAYAGYADGEWLDYKNLGTVINRAVKNAESLAGMKIKKLYIGVPGEFVTVITKEIVRTYPKPHTVTSRDLDEFYDEGKSFEQSGKYIAINSAPIYYTLDNTTRLVDPCGSAIQELKGLISFILCDMNFYRLMTKLMEKIGLKEIEFISSNWAEGMYLFDDETRDKYVLFADIGYISSSVTLMRGDGVLYQRSFSLGGGHIDADLLRVLNITYEQAVALRKRVNLSLQAGEKDKYEIIVDGKTEETPVSHVQNIVSARIMDIAEVVAECIENGDYEAPAYIPLYLTGGGIALISGAREIIATVTKRKVEIIAPNVPEHSMPQFSSVFGVMHIAARLEEKSGGIKKLINRLFR